MTLIILKILREILKSIANFLKTNCDVFTQLLDAQTQSNPEIFYNE